MTKKELSQLYWLNREVAMYDEHIESLQNKLHAERASDTVHGSSSAFPFTLRCIPLNGISNNANTRKLQTQLSIAMGQARLARERCVAEYNRLMDEIAKVPDSLTRQVLTYRYVNRLPWQQVAANIGGNSTADAVKKIAYRYFNQGK